MLDGKLVCSGLEAHGWLRQGRRSVCEAIVDVDVPAVMLAYPPRRLDKKKSRMDAESRHSVRHFRSLRRSGGRSRRAKEEADE